MSTPATSDIDNLGPLLDNFTPDQFPNTISYIGRVETTIDNITGSTDSANIITNVSADVDFNFNQSNENENNSEYNSEYDSEYDSEHNSEENRNYDTVIEIREFSINQQRANTNNNTMNSTSNISRVYDEYENDDESQYNSDDELIPQNQNQQPQTPFQTDHKFRQLVLTNKSLHELNLIGIKTEDCLTKLNEHRQQVFMLWYIGCENPQNLATDVWVKNFTKNIVIISSPTNSFQPISVSPDVILGITGDLLKVNNMNKFCLILVNGFPTKVQMGKLNEINYTCCIIKY